MSNLLAVDLDKCTGCRTCEIVCSLRHFGESNPTRSMIKVLRYERFGDYLINVPIVCQQCEMPMCKEVCPVNAISQDPKTEAYVVDATICLGCRLCVAACPMGAIEVDQEKRISSKCDLCGGDPMCVKFCVMEAISYVPRDEIGWENRRKSAEKISERLKLVAKGGV